MNHHVFLWMPYSGKDGGHRLIEQSHFGSLQEAINIALDNRERWRKQYGEGQAVVATISAYIGLQ